MPNWKKVLVSGSDASLNSLLVSTATTSSTLQVNGDSDFNGKVEIYNSGSTVFDVQGSQGQLFSITDSLSGSLFSVNDISGIPILEVFSDETVKLGTFGDEAIIVNGNETTTKNLTADGDISSSGDLYIDGGIYDNNDTLGTPDQVLFTTSTGIEWRDNIAQEAQDLVITGKNLSGDTIAKGTPLYFTGSGTSGNAVGIYPADAGNPNRMPAGGVAGESIADEVEGDVYIYGFIAGVDTSQFNAGDDVFVAVGGGYTNQKPTGSALIQKLGNVEKVDPTNGSGVIQGPSWYNDLPNWEEGKVKVGRDDGQPVTSSVIHLDETNGRMGVGTVSPTNKLHIYNNSTQGSPESHTPTGATLHIQDSSNSLYLDGNSIIGTGAGTLHIGNQSNTPMNLWTNGLNRLHITAGGNIGIGTDTPENKLHLLTTTTNSAQQLLIQNGSTGDAAIKFNISGDTYSLGIDNSDNDKFKLSAGDLGTNDRIVINSSGNVGIGTTSPSNTLHVFKDATIGAITSTNVANAGLHIQDAGANMYMDGNSIVTDNNGYLTTNGAYYFEIGTNNTPRIHVDSDGNVGIATITPTGVLNVEGNNGTWRVNRYGNTLFNNTTDTGNLWTIHPRSNGYLSFGYSAATNLNGTDEDEYFSTTYDLMTIEGSTGNVGIGTTSPSQPLTVAGNISGSGNLDIDGNTTIDGTLTATIIVETSTRELKENIKPLDSQKEVVDSLQPVSYNWKEGGKEDFGLIAEDVAEIAPDLVSYDEEGKLKGIKYSKLSVLLLDVVKKQNSVIEELSERITKLETNGGK